MENIQVVDIELEEIMGVADVAKEAGISREKALAAMSLQVIPATRVNGYITLRSIFKTNKHKLQLQR